MKQMTLKTSTVRKTIGAALNFYFIGLISLYMYIIVAYWNVTAYLGPLLQFAMNTILPLLILGVAFRVVKRYEKNNSKIIIGLPTKNV